MELIAAILIAGPLGYFTRRGLRNYLIVWAVIFPVQTWQVLHVPSHDEWAYWPVNLVILGLGIGLNRLGRHLRVRRAEVQGGLVMRAAARSSTIER